MLSNLMLKNLKGVYMLRKVIILIFVSFVIASAANAEPIVLQQAGNVLKPGELEAGIDFYYGYETYTISGVTGEYKNTAWSAMLALKYALMDALEVKVGVPYSSWNISGAGTGSNNGLSSILAGAKLCFVKGDQLSFGLGVDTEIPVTSADKSVGEGMQVLIRGGFMTYQAHGFNIVPLAMMDYKSDPFLIHVNLGYKLAGAYTTTAIEIKPASFFIYAFGAELPLKDTPLTLLGEFAGTFFGKATVAGVEQADTNGTTYDFTPGIRFNSDTLKAKLGVSIALGDATYRTYDWKIISGVSMVF